MRALIISGYGINCEDETLHAFAKVGFKGSIIHVSDLIDNPKKLNQFQVLAFPGGFSYGDDTGSGNAMANKIKNNLFDHLLEFLSKDKLVIGICNGCQILVNLGIVPAVGKTTREVALVENNTAVYQCRWINLKITNHHSHWLKNIQYMYLPVAHQEGKFMMNKNIQTELTKNNLIACQYVNQNRKLAKQKFPYNPNGSILDIAALTNGRGNVLAMMPHPERALYKTQEPDWINDKGKRSGYIKSFEFADGYKIFKNASDYFK